MLDEAKRQQLDTIVQQMVDNNEADEDIQLVVNDFKSKYSTQQATDSAKQPTVVGNIIRGIAKPFARLAVTAGTSDQYGLPKTVQSKYFGEVKPVGNTMWNISRQQATGDFSATNKDIIKGAAGGFLSGLGNALEIGTTVASPTAPTTAVKSYLANPGFKTLVSVAKQGMKAGIKPAALGSAGFGLTQLTEDESGDFGDVLKALASTGIGFAGGTILSGAGSAVGAAATRGVQKAGAKLGIESAQKATQGFEKAKQTTQVSDFKQNLSNFVKEFTPKKRLVDTLEKNEDTILNKYVEILPDVQIKGGKVNSSSSVKQVNDKIAENKNAFLRYSNEIPTVKTPDEILARANFIIDELQSQQKPVVFGDMAANISDKMESIIKDTFRKKGSKNFTELDLDATSFYNRARTASGALNDSVAGEAYSILGKAIRDTIKDELPDEVAKASYKELQDLIIFKNFLENLNGANLKGNKLLAAGGRALGWISGMNTGGGFAAATVGGEFGEEAGKIMSRLPFYNLRRQQKIIEKYKQNNPSLASKIDEFTANLQKVKAQRAEANRIAQEADTAQRLANPRLEAPQAIRMPRTEPQNLGMALQSELNKLPVYDYTLPEHVKIVQKAMSDANDNPYRYRQIFSEAVDNLQKVKDSKEMFDEAIKQGALEIYDEAKKRLPIISQLQDEEDIVRELVDAGIDEGVALSEVETIMSLNKTGTKKGYTTLLKDMALETSNVNLKSGVVEAKFTENIAQ